jgi:hypothetical protein
MSTTTILVTPAQAADLHTSLRARRRDLVGEGADPLEVLALDELVASVDRARRGSGVHPVTGQRGPLWSALYQLVYTRSGELHDLCLAYWRGRSGPGEIEAAIGSVAAGFALLRRLEEGPVPA